MGSESLQKKLDRVRKPRVHITYDVETEGAQVTKELPFVVGVLGDFSGQPTEPLKPLKDRKFIGSHALQRFAADKSQPVRIGLQCDGKRVPREGCPVLHNGAVVGTVTSGTFSPTFNHPIAMAYVTPSASAIGTQLTTDIRGTQYPAIVVPLPFYQRPK